MKCEICKQDTFPNIRSLSLHIASQHTGTNYKEYYDEYLKKPDEGICKCSTCTNETKFIGITKGYREFCSVRCVSKEKRGKDSGYWEQLQKKCEAEHGVKAFSALPEVQQKIKETREKKYGAFHSKETLEKMKVSTLTSSGVDCVLKDKSRRKEWDDKREIETGFRYSIMDPEVKSKAIATKQSKEHILETREKFRDSFVSKLESVNCSLVDIVGTNEITFKCNLCGSEFTDTRNFVFTDRADKGISPCLCCKPRHGFTSIEEETLVKEIKTFYDSSKMILNDRSILGGKEIDIVFPEIGLGLEYDGLFFHREDKVGRNFHLEKTKGCEAKNIHLIHIFSDEYELKHDIVLSRIKSLLHKSDRVIYARKCEIRDVDTAAANDFLLRSHIQGICMASTKIGLYYNDELVALMTFGRSRYERNFTELLRFCNALNTNVVGGAGKLLSYYRKLHPDETIVSYADRRWSDGNLYKKLGFTLEGISKPSYSYFKNRKDGRFNRLQFQKYKLVEQGYDPSMTEEEIMRSRGFYRIYDCGQYKFIMKP